MSKLIFRSENNYEIQLDISSTMRRAIHSKNPKELDRALSELKSLIVKNTIGLHPPYKKNVPWFEQRMKSR